MTLFVLLYVCFLSGVVFASEEQDDPPLLSIYDVCSAVQDGGLGSGVLLSPNMITGDDSYAENSDCNFEISNPNPGGSVLLTFDHFDLEYEGQGACDYDYLSINGNKFCAGMSLYTLCLTDEVIQFHFFTDDYPQTNDLFTGFKIEFRIEPYNQCQCITEVQEDGSGGDVCLFPFVHEGETFYQCYGSSLDTFCATAVGEGNVLTSQGKCNQSVPACEQKCLTEGGVQCLIPYVDSSADIQVDTCSFSTGRNAFTCPTKRGRLTNQPSHPEYLKMQNLQIRNCAATGCNRMDGCGAKSRKSFGQFVSRPTPALITSSYSYNINYNCVYEFVSLTGMYYSFTFHKLNTWCQDTLTIYDSTDSFRYNLCSNTSRVSESEFTLCVPAANISIDFLTTNQNDPQVSKSTKRSGFTVTYSQIEKSECEVLSDTGSACSGGVEVLGEPGEIMGPMYPQAYPSYSSCQWEVSTGNEDTFVLIQVLEMELGIYSPEFEVVDAIKVSDNIQTDLSYKPLMSKPYPQFISSSPNVSIEFQSSQLFNWHENFRLDVQFVTLADNRSLFVSAGFCLSEDDQSICQFPFQYDGQNYSDCSLLEPADTNLSCISTRGEKVFCNLNLDSCNPASAQFRSAALSVTSETSVSISWEVSNTFWSHFSVKVDGQVRVSALKSLSYDVDNLSGTEFHSIEVFMKAVNLQDESIYFLVNTDTEIVVKILPSTEVSVSWGSSVKVESISATSDSSFNDKFQQLVDRLVVSQTRKRRDVSQTRFVNENETSVDLSLNPGLVYNVTLNSNISMTVSVPPKPISVTENNIELNVVEEGLMTLSGTLTGSTVCESFQLQEHLKDTVDESGVDQTVMTVDCSLENGCISTNGSFFVQVNSSNIKFGNCCNFYVTSTTQDTNSRVNKFDYCTRPPSVDEASILPEKITTTSMTLTWTAPSASTFDIFVASITHCISCECDVIESLEDRELSSPRLTLSNLIPGVQYNVTLRTKSVYSKFQTDVDQAKFSDPVTVSYDTRAVDPTPIDIVYDKDTKSLFVSWPVPSLPPGQAGTVGDRSGFEVTFLRDSETVEKVELNTAGSFRAVTFDVSEPANLYFIKIQTVSCSGTLKTRGYEVKQLSIPDPPTAADFLVKDISTSSVTLQCTSSFSPTHQTTELSFILEFNGISREVTCEDGDKDVVIEGLDPNKVLNITATTKAFNVLSNINTVFSESFPFTVATVPEQDVIQNENSTASDYDKILINYFLQGVVVDFTQMIVSARSLDSPDEDPIMQVFDISNENSWAQLAGISSDERYEVTVSLRQSNGVEYLMRVFNNTPFGLSIMTKLEISNLGFTTVELSLTDDFDFSETSYLISVEGGNESITVAKNEQCIETEEVCKIWFQPLEPGRDYVLKFQTQVGDALSVPQYLSVSTVALQPDNIQTTESSAILSINETNLPFLGRPDITDFYIVVTGDAVETSDLEAMSIFSTWFETYNATSSDSNGFYRATGNLGYPPSESENVQIQDSLFQFKIGTQSFDDCQTLGSESICDGPLKPQTTYKLWFVAESNDDTRTFSGPFGSFVTAALETSVAVNSLSSSSVSLKFNDVITSSDAVYEVSYKPKESSVVSKRSTEESTMSLSRDKLCNSETESCVMYIHGLRPSTDYDFEAGLSLNQFKSEDKNEVSARTITPQEDVSLEDVTRTTLVLRATFPFLRDPRIRKFLVLVALENDTFLPDQNFNNTWEQVVNQQGSPSGNTWIYKPYPELAYPNIEQDSNIEVIGENTIKFTLGETGNCENEVFCNGNLNESDYFVWFIGIFGPEDADQMAVSGPFGSFLPKSQSQSALTAGAGLILFVIFGILLIILVVLLVVYCLRHGGRSKKQRHHERNPVLWTPAANMPVDIIGLSPSLKSSPAVSTRNSVDPSVMRADFSVNPVRPMDLPDSVGAYRRDTEPSASPDYEFNPLSDEILSPELVKITAAPAGNATAENIIPRLRSEISPQYHINQAYPKETPGL